MAPNENSVSHILVIRLSAMGDVAMTVPVLSAVCSKHPETKITVLTRKLFEPMFAQLPNVQVYVVEVNGKHKGLFGLWHLYKELKRLDIDGVADLHNVLRSKILKQFFRFAGIPFKQIDKGRAEKKALTASTNKTFKPLKSTHRRYADVFESLGLPVHLDEAVSQNKLPLTKKVEDMIGDNPKIKIGIAPFAAFPGKMYPLELMEDVIENLNNSNAYQLLCLGGGETEIAQLDLWEEKFNSCINCARKLSFEDELALISNLELMLSMDSGNGHLAAIYGIPVVTLWGVTHPHAGFSPFGHDPDNALLADRTQYPLIPTSVYGNKMPEGYEKAMETIAPVEVFHKIQHVLRKK